MSRVFFKGSLCTELLCLLLLEKFLRRVRTLYGALRIAPNSPVHINAVIYAITNCDTLISNSAA